MNVSQSKSIGGKKFTVFQLPGRRGLRLSRRVMGWLAPLSRAIGYVEGGKSEDLAEALRGALQSMSEADLDQLAQELLENALVDDKPLWPQFDVVMQGQVASIYELLYFALGVNFSDFFYLLRPLLDGALSRLAGAVEKAGPSPKS